MTDENRKAGIGTRREGQGSLRYAPHVWWVLSMVAVSGCGRQVDPAIYAKFETAQQAFDAAESPEDFRRAAALYQEILDGGVTSGAVLYNQGNAFMRASMRGRALACYRQAKWYRPRDPYLEANLRNVARLSPAAGAPRPFIEYLLFWQEWISFPGKFRASLGCALLTLALAAIGVWWRRRSLLRLAAVMLGVSIIAVLSATYDWYRFVHIRHGVVAGDPVIARKGNADSYEPAFNKPLEVATEFTVLEERGDWLLIRLVADGEREGWIPRGRAVVY